MDHVLCSMNALAAAALLLTATCARKGTSAVLHGDAAQSRACLRACMCACAAPFITEEVWRLYAQAAKLLLAPGGELAEAGMAATACWVEDCSPMHVFCVCQAHLDQCPAVGLPMLLGAWCRQGAGVHCGRERPAHGRAPGLQASGLQALHPPPGAQCKHALLSADCGGGPVACPHVCSLCTPAALLGSPGRSCTVHQHSCAPAHRSPEPLQGLPATISSVLILRR